MLCGVTPAGSDDSSDAETVASDVETETPDAETAALDAETEALHADLEAFLAASKAAKATAEGDTSTEDDNSTENNTSANGMKHQRESDAGYEYDEPLRRYLLDRTAEPDSSSPQSLSPPSAHTRRTRAAASPPPLSPTGSTTCRWTC